MKCITDYELVKLNAKIQSLTQEIRYIKNQEKRALQNHKQQHPDEDNPDTTTMYTQLRYYRKFVLAVEFRALLLVRAFLTGKEYASLESNIINFYAARQALYRAAELAEKHCSHKLKWEIRDQMEQRLKSAPIGASVELCIKRKEERNRVVKSLWQQKLVDWSGIDTLLTFHKLSV